MDYGKIVENSFSYTKTGIWGNWIKCVLLIILAALPFIWISVWTLLIMPPSSYMKLSLNNLIYIASFGWDTFVSNFVNNFK